MLRTPVRVHLTREQLASLGGPGYRLRWTIGLFAFCAALTLTSHAALSQNEPSMHTHAGAPAEGFALALSAAPLVMHLGAPIPVTVELRNVTDHLQRVIFGAKDWIYTFRVKKQGSDGMLPVLAPHDGAAGGPSHGWAMPQGCSAYSYRDLNDHVRLTEPGIYRVTVSSVDLFEPRTFRRITLGSNEIEINVRE